MRLASTFPLVLVALIIATFALHHVLGSGGSPAGEPHVHLQARRQHEYYEEGEGEVFASSGELASQRSLDRRLDNSSTNDDGEAEESTSATSSTTTTTTTTAPQRLVAGVFGRIIAHSAVAEGLEVAGRVRIRPIEESCGSPNSHIMEDSVVPSCAGHICAGPPNRLRDLVWWDGVRIVHPGLYRVCWCEPHAKCKLSSLDYLLEDCCTEGSDYSQDEGGLEVTGPDWIEEEPIEGQSFTISMTGSSLDITSGLKLRVVGAGSDNGICGGDLSAEEESSSEVIASEDDKDVGIWQVRLFRRVQYRLCWCAGGSNSGTYGFDDPFGNPCTADHEFAGEVGLLSPRGAETEESLSISAVAGVRFSFTVSGDSLMIGDRMRIVSSTASCGQDYTDNDDAVISYICGRGSVSCQTSPVAFSGLPELLTDSPTTDWSEDGATDVEEWGPIALSTPGDYRLCWCQDTTWDPDLLVSRDGYCSMENSFSVEVGALRVEGAYVGQNHSCYAFTSCTLVVRSSITMSLSDQIMVVPYQDGLALNCGLGATGLRVAAVAIGAGVQGALMTTTTLVGTSPKVDCDENCTTTTTVVTTTLATGASDSSHWSGTGHVAAFGLDMVGQPGQFSVCYCRYASAGGECDEAVVFGQSAGALQVSVAPEGVETEYYWSPAIVCDAGQQCTFTLEGLWASQITASDAFYAIPTSWSCGEVVEESSIFWLTSKTISTAVQKAYFQHSDDSLYEVGDYQMCYCASSTLASGETCSDRSNFLQAAGLLWVVGVKIQQTWECTQGVDCTLDLPGWRLSASDKIVIIETTDSCAVPGYSSATPSEDFPNILNASSATTLPSRMISVAFPLGDQIGAGSWKVCLCSSLASPTSSVSSGSACGDLTDFVQEAGELTVDGALKGVYELPSLPSAGRIVTVVADTTYKGGAIMCAVSTTAMARAPYYVEVQYCETRIEGCLGMASLPYGSSLGANLVHIPIDADALAASGSDTVHVWCVGDKAYCTNQVCAMPSTGEGLEIEMMPGVKAWEEWWTARHQTFDLVVTGDPMNAAGGTLQIQPRTGDCGDTSTTLSITHSKIERPGKSVTWKGMMFPSAGYYKVCWCDRKYGSSCVLWENIGQIGVAGPTRSSGTPTSPALATETAFEIQLWGLNLSESHNVGVLPGRVDCTNEESIENITALDPLWAANSSTAMYSVVSPSVPGNFTICWGPGEGALLNTHVTFGECFLVADCVVDENWTAVLDASTGEVACTRTCGGGLATWQRLILSEPRGGGAECPSEESRTKTMPCNTDRCPVAEPQWSWTDPQLVANGTDFTVLVEGENFDPSEDAVALLPSELRCGAELTEEHFPEGIDGYIATCTGSRSSETLLACSGFNIDDPGVYRVCVCDYSEDNVTSGCSTLSAFKFEPTNYSVVEVVGLDGSTDPSGSGSDGGGDDDGSDDDSQLSETISRGKDVSYEQDTSSSLLMAGIGAILLFPIVAIAIAGCRYYSWKREKARLRSKIAALRGSQQEGEDDGEGKPKTEHEELVERATREAWDAYNRTLAEHMHPEMFEEAEEGDCGGNPWLLDVQSTRSSLATSFSRTNTESHQDTRSSSPSGDRTSSSFGASASGPSSRPTTATSTFSERSAPRVATGGSMRSRTPPPRSGGNRLAPPTPNVSPPATGDSGTTGRTPSQGLTPPRSGGSVNTISSRPSLLRVELQQMQPQVPTMGGSFLDLPLMGKPTAPPSTTIPPPGGSPSMVRPIPISRPGGSPTPSKEVAQTQAPLPEQQAEPRPPEEEPEVLGDDEGPEMQMPSEPAPDLDNQAIPPIPAISVEPPRSPSRAATSQEEPGQAKKDEGAGPIVNHTGGLPEPPPKIDLPASAATGLSRKPPAWLMGKPVLPVLPRRAHTSSGEDGSMLVGLGVPPTPPPPEEDKSAVQASAAAAPFPSMTPMLPTSAPLPPPRPEATASDVATLPSMTPSLPSSAPLPPPRPEIPKKSPVEGEFGRPPPTPMHLAPPTPAHSAKHSERADATPEAAFSPKTPNPEDWPTPSSAPPSSPMPPDKEEAAPLPPAETEAAPELPTDTTPEPRDCPPAEEIAPEPAKEAAKPKSKLRARVGYTLLAGKAPSSTDKGASASSSAAAAGKPGGLMAAAKASGARLRSQAAAASAPPKPVQDDSMEPPTAPTTDAPPLPSDSSKDEQQESSSVELPPAPAPAPLPPSGPAPPDSADAAPPPPPEEPEHQILVMSPSPGEANEAEQSPPSNAGSDLVVVDDVGDIHGRWRPQAGDGQDRLRQQWHAKLTAQPTMGAPPGGPRVPIGSLRSAAKAGGPRQPGAASAPAVEGHGFRRRRQNANGDELASNAPSESSFASFAPSVGTFAADGSNQGQGPLPGGPRAAGQTPNWAFFAP